MAFPPEIYPERTRPPRVASWRCQRPSAWKRSRASGLVILTIISDATTPLLISLSREMTELELDTLPRRKAARGAVVYIVMVIFHHYILSVCLSLWLNGLLKISEKIWSRQGFSFTLCSHFSSAIHIPFTFYSQNAPTSISISGLGGVKEWKKKIALPDVFPTFIRFSWTFPPLIFSPRQTVSRHLAGKAHCNAGAATHWHARKTAPQCCKHRQLVSPTKLKPFCMKFQIFHFTLTSLDFTRLHSTSLLAI